MDVGGEEIKRMRERIDIGKVDKTLNDNVANINRMKGLIEGAGRDWAWWYGRETFWLTLKTYSPEDAAAGAQCRASTRRSTTR
ncbi:hypothetical protein G6F58_013248 [Rhizopus delemar]|nr:hypothetical protein G6F58_013248 [Rhizopus delemar]